MGSSDCRGTRWRPSSPTTACSSCSRRSGSLSLPRSGRPFSRFPRSGLAKVGHIPPQDNLAQLQELGAQLYACGPSMEHYKIDPDDLALENVIVSEYLTFMEQMHSADIHLYV